MSSSLRIVHVYHYRRWVNVFIWRGRHLHIYTATASSLRRLLRTLEGHKDEQRPVGWLERHFD